MDEASFLQSIVESSHHPKLVRSFAAWLLEHDDKRGQYLRLELDRRATETRLLELENKLHQMNLFDGFDPAWLDTILPLRIVSPMVGRFYSAPTPDSDPYVTLGDLCTPNTIVGVIESMLVFNEIPAGTSGVISEILVSSGDPVDYARPLFCLTRPPRLLAGG
jgi:hypothetical protein